MRQLITVAKRPCLDRLHAVWNVERAQTLIRLHLTLSNLGDTRLPTHVFVHAAGELLALVGNTVLGGVVLLKSRPLLDEIGHEQMPDDLVLRKGALTKNPQRGRYGEIEVRRPAESTVAQALYAVAPDHRGEVGTHGKATFVNDAYLTIGEVHPHKSRVVLESILIHQFKRCGGHIFLMYATTLVEDGHILVVDMVSIHHLEERIVLRIVEALDAHATGTTLAVVPPLIEVVSGIELQSIDTRIDIESVTVAVRAVERRVAVLDGQPLDMCRIEHRTT